MIIFPSFLLVTLWITCFSNNHCLNLACLTFMIMHLHPNSLEELDLIKENQTTPQTSLPYVGQSYTPHYETIVGESGEVMKSLMVKMN